MTEAKRLLDAAQDLLVREGVYLDEQRWDEWLALYAEDCEYWVPTWIAEERLATDPKAQVSHIYYANRLGLEDRIARIRTGKAPSAIPLRRTAHSFGNLMLTQAGEQRFSCRSTWACRVYDPHSKKSFEVFGHAAYELRSAPGGWQIARKKTVLQNDTLPAMLDVYCL